MGLTVGDVDAYRDARDGEITHRGEKPSSTTLDREVELLKRVLNYAVACKRIPSNPVAQVKLVRQSNVRRTVVTEDEFDALLDACEEPLRPIVLMAFDTGMREGEILGLRWEQVDLKHGFIHLNPQDTKANDARNVPLTPRLLKTLGALPRGLPGVAVFRNPDTKEPWQEIRKMWHRALAKFGREGIWFHDLRRSFVTRARRRGIPESVVMKLSGHKTRAVFDRYNIIDDGDLQRAALVLAGR